MTTPFSGLAKQERLFHLTARLQREGRASLPAQGGVWLAPPIGENARLQRTVTAKLAEEMPTRKIVPVTIDAVDLDEESVTIEDPPDTVVEEGVLEIAPEPSPEVDDDGMVVEPQDEAAGDERNGQSDVVTDNE